jgi:hypothetical protein
MTAPYLLMHTMFDEAGPQIWAIGVMVPGG